MLDSLSMNVPLHSVTGLTGPNGGGKSTLFEVIAGYFSEYSGEMLWQSSSEVALLQQQLLPKKFLPVKVREFVEMGTWGPVKKSAPALKVNEALETLDLRGVENKLIGEISGGQWRRSLLARTLVQPADLYLLDEPFNQIDLEIESRIGSLLRALVKNSKKTFLIISHDWHAMDHYFDHLLVINKRLLAEGSVREMSDVFLNWRNPEHHTWMHMSRE